ncbi:MAG: ABC transporter permease [Clostridiaceae bacterium]|nr:ABC transporter permease [Eubacteriales bacterium]
MRYLSLFRVRFLHGLQYRAAAYAGVATQFAWGFMEILMFSAFYKANSAAFPMSFQALSSYIWLQQAFLALFMMWFLDEDIFASIRDGHVAYELARPLDLYGMWYVKNAAVRLSKAALRCMPVLFVAALLPAPYGITLPPDPAAFLWFLLTGILAYLLVVAYCMLIYIATLHTVNPMGVRLVAVAMADFFAGGYVPLPFLPDKVRAVFELLPFGSMQNLPLLAYSGTVSGKELLYKALLQAFWLAALVAFGRVWMKYSLKKVVVQGG